MNINAYRYVRQEVRAVLPMGKGRKVWVLLLDEHMVTRQTKGGTPGTDSAQHRGQKSMACWEQDQPLVKPQNWTSWWPGCSDSYRSAHQMEAVRLLFYKLMGTVAQAQGWRKGAKVMISVLDMNS